MRYGAGRMTALALAALVIPPLIGGALTVSGQQGSAEKYALRAPQQAQVAAPRLSMVFTQAGFPTDESALQRRLLWASAVTPKRVSSWPVKIEPAPPAKARTLVAMAAEAPLPPPRPAALDAADLKRLIAPAPTASEPAPRSALAGVAERLPFTRSVASAVSGLGARVASLVPDL